MNKSSQFEVEEYIDPPKEHDEEDNATYGSIEKMVLAIKQATNEIEQMLKNQDKNSVS